MKKNLTDLLESAKELKNQASKVGKEAAKTAGTVKAVVSAGVGKATKIVNRDALSTGLEAASKGIDVAAKGAKTLSKSMEVASETIKKASNKLKKSP